jgi:ATP-dependent Clp protease ATP-binding subunit ClpC
MGVLRKHFRPEFLNRIDEVIVFHALTKDEIKQIVQLQLDRVKRTAHAQDIKLEFDDALVDYLAEIGYQPEFGARELKRQIRTQVETRLASTLLGGEVSEGDTVTFRYDQDSDKVFFIKEPRQGTPEQDLPMEPDPTVTDHLDPYAGPPTPARRRQPTRRHPE